MPPSAHFLRISLQGPRRGCPILGSGDLAPAQRMRVKSLILILFFFFFCPLGCLLCFRLRHAVQELETSQVLKHLKYVELV